MDNLQKIFWVALAVTILAWVGVGIYYLTSRVPEMPKAPTPQHFLQVEEQKASQKIRYFPISDNYSLGPGEKVVEGTITQSGRGEFMLTSEGQNFHFFLDKDSLFYFPEGTNGAVEGARLKVYYKEKDNKFYLMYGLGIK